MGLTLPIIAEELQKTLVLGPAPGPDHRQTKAPFQTLSTALSKLIVSRQKFKRNPTVLPEHHDFLRPQLLTRRPAARREVFAYQVPGLYPGRFERVFLMVGQVGAVMVEQIDVV